MLNTNYLILKKLQIDSNQTNSDEIPMAREKSKNTHTDCIGSECAVEEVDNVLKMKMEGKKDNNDQEKFIK